jgi:hydroxymethylpyrimidine pyrophosphatase-like HAD family hydrolase
MRTPCPDRDTGCRCRFSKLVLATDLDGTLLAGSGEARRQVRELFSGSLAGATLVFVTGVPRHYNGRG